MQITLYSAKVASPPARAVEMIVKILKLDVEIVKVDLLKKEHYQPWFAKLNPARQVPVLDDNGYILTDSHAIMTYLLNAHAPKDVLEQYYPTDAKERGIIDSRLHFDNETLFARVKAIMLPLLVTRVNEPLPLEKTQYLAEGVQHLEKILEGKEFLAADRLTLADISTIPSVDLVEFLLPLKQYENVASWAERIRKVCPFYEEVNRERLDDFVPIFKATQYDVDDRWEQIQILIKLKT